MDIRTLSKLTSTRSKPSASDMGQQMGRPGDGTRGRAYGIGDRSRTLRYGKAALRLNGFDPAEGSKSKKCRPLSCFIYQARKKRRPGCPFGVTWTFFRGIAASPSAVEILNDSGFRRKKA